MIHHRTAVFCKAEQCAQALYITAQSVEEGAFACAEELGGGFQRDFESDGFAADMRRTRDFRRGIACRGTRACIAGRVGRR